MNTSTQFYTTYFLSVSASVSVLGNVNTPLRKQVISFHTDLVGHLVDGIWWYLMVIVDSVGNLKKCPQNSRMENAQRK